MQACAFQVEIPLDWVKRTHGFSAGRHAGTSQSSNIAGLFVGRAVNPAESQALIDGLRRQFQLKIMH